MKSYNLIFLLFVFLITSCNWSDKNNNNSQPSRVNYYEVYQEEDSYYEDDSNEFEDGTYSATVDYYNPETGYSETYYLDVEVEDNNVTIIYFNNGGYLDYDHITPDELDEDGYVYIYGEEGKTYEIQIDY